MRIRLASETRIPHVRIRLPFLYATEASTVRGLGLATPTLPLALLYG